MTPSRHMTPSPAPLFAQADEFIGKHAERAGPVLSVVVPTFNERDNLEPFLRELSRALTGIEWEAIFVDDDSPDGTAALAREIGCNRGRVRCVQRIGRRGLASACIEGMLASSAPYLAVMDADLQHDPSILPEMLKRLQRSQAELVVGSRYMGGGEVGEWSFMRRAISRCATLVGRMVVPKNLHDPMSGFF